MQTTIFVLAAVSVVPAAAFACAAAWSGWLGAGDVPFAAIALSILVGVGVVVSLIGSLFTWPTALVRSLPALRSQERPGGGRLSDRAWTVGAEITSVGVAGLGVLLSALLWASGSRVGVALSNWVLIVAGACVLVAAVARAARHHRVLVVGGARSRLCVMSGLLNALAGVGALLAACALWMLVVGLVVTLGYGPAPAAEPVGMLHDLSEEEQAVHAGAGMVFIAPVALPLMVAEAMVAAFEAVMGPLLVVAGLGVTMLACVWLSTASLGQSSVFLFASRARRRVAASPA
ncbi:MAG: hypothetical protein AAGK04_03380 [Planctomycetota bacterium]